MGVRILTCKDAIFHTDDYDVVLVGTNIYDMLTNGFQSKIRFKYPYVDEANMETGYGDTRKLGKRLTVAGEPTISLMYIANYPNRKRVTIDYEALEHAMTTANSEFIGKRVMTTVLGCSPFDGNGDRGKVLEIIGRHCDKMDLTVYDYEQTDRQKEIAAYSSMMARARKDGTVSCKERLERVLKKIYLK